MTKSSPPTDFHWSYTDEPHASRRKEILAKYPQIKELYGYDPKTKYMVTLLVMMQISMAYMMRESHGMTILLCAYCVGAFATHSLFLAMHEISHNLAFEKAVPNKLLGVFANLVTIFPHFSMFQRYHMEHHTYQGVDGMDTDMPTRFEGNYITNTLLKAIWVFCMPLVYVFRPLYVKPKDPGLWEAINWTAVILFDVLIWYELGTRSLVYLALCTFLGSGFHPAAGHFIAEHYMFRPGQETYSYYGPLNLLFFNVGYHNEHHDFPRIPGSRLPQLRAIAHEYYDDLMIHTSWVKVIWNYITDPTINPFSRVMRKDTRIEKKSD